MNAAQKRAWFRIIVTTISLFVFLALIPFTGITVASAAFGLLGLNGYDPSLFRKKKSSNEVDTDERDILFSRRAGVAAGMISYLTFCLTSFVIMGIYWNKPMIPKGSIGVILLAGCIALILAHSIYTLIIYGRENRHEDA